MGGDRGDQHGPLWPPWRDTELSGLSWGVPRPRFLLEGCGELAMVPTEGVAGPGGAGGPGPLGSRDGAGEALGEMVTLTVVVWCGRLSFFPFGSCFLSLGKTASETSSVSKSLFRNPEAESPSHLLSALNM